MYYICNVNKIKTKKYMSYSSICQTFSREADFGLQAVLTKVIDQFGAFELNAAGELVSTKKFKIICEIDDSEFIEGNVVTTSSRGRKSTNTIGPSSSSNVSVTITEEEDDESDEPVMVITVGESKDEVLEDLNLEESDLDTPVMEVEQEQQEQIVSSLPLNETSDEEESLEEEIVSPVSLEKQERSHLLSSKLKNAAKKKNNKN